MLDINETIQETMPRHLYKREFIETDTFEHHRLFGEMVVAVQNNGKGLEQIVFYDPNSIPLGKLLTKSEIIHLQDVSNLIASLNWISLALIVICLLILASIVFYRISMPALKTIIAGTIAIVCALGLVVLIVGAKKLFYWLHTIIFPKNHQWFFYYEESLMSMLMKAPELFGPVSLQLLFFGIVIWVLQLMLIRALIKLV